MKNSTPVLFNLKNFIQNCLTCETPDFCQTLSNMLLLFLFYLSAMKGKAYGGVLLGLACFLVLAQNAAHFRSHFETYAELCCEKLSNSSDLRCWNKTQETKNTTNTTTLAQCTQKMARKACFNVTAVQPCQDDPAENSLEPGKKEIHIGAFVPFLTDDRYGYSNAMKMAIALINNRTDILDNYTLVLDSEDTHWVSVVFLFSLMSF